jgi:hypothetical protein
VLVGRIALACPPVLVAFVRFMLDETTTNMHNMSSTKKHARRPSVMRRIVKRLTVWVWVLWASKRRSPREAERGSQSLEWVGLGAVVMAIMTAAYKACADGGLGAGVGAALANFLKQHLAQ